MNESNKQVQQLGQWLPTMIQGLTDIKDLNICGWLFGQCLLSLTSKSHIKEKNLDRLKKSTWCQTHSNIQTFYLILSTVETMQTSAGSHLITPNIFPVKLWHWVTLQKSQPLFGTAKVRVSKFIRSSWSSRSCLPTPIPWPAATTLEASPSQVSFASFMPMDSRRPNIARDTDRNPLLFPSTL